MNLQQQTQNPVHVKIGRYQSRLENGQLKLYYHQIGAPTGMSCTFTPEETKDLLAMLTSRSDDIESASRTSESEPSFGKRYSLV
jgi:hypothetical protein